MLLTDAPSLRTLRSNPRSRSKPRSRPPRSIPRSIALPCLEEWDMWRPSSTSPRSEGSGSESDKRDDVDGGDKWSTEPTGDVADSDICIPARRCTYKVFISTSYVWSDAARQSALSWILTRIWRDSSCEVSVYQSASPSSGAAPRSITTWLHTIDSFRNIIPWQKCQMKEYKHLQTRIPTNYQRHHTYTSVWIMRSEIGTWGQFR